ncbi:MAG: helix-turn-helix domain-containing protein [Pseudonocardia sp.]
MLMTATMDDHTVLPPAESGQLRRLAEAMTAATGSESARLVGPDGATLELPGEVYDLLRQVVKSLADGLAITVAPRQTMLTTQEAADLLGVSRPTLVRLLEDKQIPFTRVGRHRRVALADLLDYREESRKRGRAALREMTQNGEQAKLHEIADRPRPTR